ncbi:hypothetical protein F4859DRAFT_421576 [Xylaria cf. heliscus]|nr:hypothetical protein F4859DRAFT_421576 [Xylaria cf. heliscus]
MPRDDNTIFSIKAIMASLPPTEAQNPISASQAETDAHNASILNVRGLRTTATGNELFDLADLALRNSKIPTTSEHTADADAATTSAVASETLPTVTTFEPFYFFFYGSLQVPNVLQGVCRIKDKNSITLRKNANIVGWKIKMWGPYPALVPAAPDDEDGHVEGVAWLCERPEYVARLCTYESKAYRMAYCNVLVAAGDKSPKLIKNARTFVFDQDQGDTLTDGRFDIEQYCKDILGPW